MELREKIINIISNNCSRRGFDEYTIVADQILALIQPLKSKECSCGKLLQHPDSNKKCPDCGGVIPKINLPKNNKPQPDFEEGILQPLKPKEEKAKPKIEYYPECCSKPDIGLNHWGQDYIEHICFNCQKTFRIKPQENNNTAKSKIEELEFADNDQDNFKFYLVRSKINELVRRVNGERR